MKRFCSLLLVFCLLAATLPSRAAVRLADVTDDLWCHAEIETLVEEGVVSGYEDGCYHPEASVTYGAALKLILRAAGAAEQKPTAADSVFSGYCDYALKKGYVEASEVPSLSGVASRLFIARLTARALRLPPSSAASPYADTRDGYAVALEQTGIMQGSYRGGVRVLKANDGINRGEMAAIVWRIGHTSWRSIFSENSGKIVLGGSTYDILPGLPVNAWDASSFGRDANAYLTYPGTRLGVDVSSYQGDIDWEKVAASGVTFAIVRVGYRGYGAEGTLNEDKNYLANVTGAKAAGLTVGAYFFSQALTEDEAREEADFLLSRIDGLGVDGPVVFDWERVSSASSSRTRNLGRSALTACSLAFCREVEAAGYTPVVYFYQNLAYSGYDLTQIAAYDWWLAEYDPTPKFYYDFGLWQYSDSGAVPGIEGKVDMDLWRVNF